MNRRFPDAVVTAIDKSKILGIRAGTRPHRFIGIWAVVVDGRVFVRSWGQKPRSWYRTFLEDSRGAVQIPGRTRAVSVHAVATRSERLRDAVDRAYREKYNTPGSVKFVRGFARPTRRATTMELVPLRARAVRRRPGVRPGK